MILLAEHFYSCLFSSPQSFRWTKQITGDIFLSSLWWCQNTQHAGSEFVWLVFQVHSELSFRAYYWKFIIPYWQHHENKYKKKPVYNWFLFLSFMVKVSLDLLVNYSAWETNVALKECNDLHFNQKCSGL